MAITFEGQVAVVTGAGQGLGKAYALELARRGAKVVVNDIGGLDSPDGSSAQAVVREIEAAGGAAVASHDTVATPEGGKAIIDAALDNFGTVDAVIHNAGTWRHVTFEEMTPDNLDPVLDVHLRGAFYVARPAWTVMKARGYGRIVLTSSSTGMFGRVAGTNYAAAKAGMFGLARGMALEGEELGIKTNCILPVAPFGDRRDVPAVLTDHLARTGLAPEKAGPDMVMPMVTYLASQACDVTGEAFSAGGGRFGRVFVGVADGWVSTADAVPSAEDVAAHWPEIEDRSSYAIPPTSIDELGVIGRLRKERGEA
ncbi:MAG: SDR family NAD(P)-dependent oxidoreductase [Novosphingobium sp.]|nr:SDR family NAD(P)-dependent oxidoreductase [Novosphingobium sp.]